MIHEVYYVPNCGGCNKVIKNGKSALFYRNLYFCNIKCWRNYCVALEVEFIKIEYRDDVK